MRFQVLLIEWKSNIDRNLDDLISKINALSDRSELPSGMVSKNKIELVYSCITAERKNF